MPLLEICCYSLRSCLLANSLPSVGRIELCSSPPSGGLTPSLGLVRLVKNKISIPLSIMIRPRGADFCYSSLEFEVMLADIQIIKEHLDVDKGDGFVFGILTEMGEVDVERTRQLVRLAAPFKVTFHRAIDMAVDPIASLEAIIEAGCHRILSSGQAPSAELGIDVLAQLVHWSKGRIEIMAGAGINAENVGEIVRQTGVTAVHGSASATVQSTMVFRPQKVSMTSAGDSASEWSWSESNYEKIQTIGQVLATCR